MSRKLHRLLCIIKGGGGGRQYRTHMELRVLRKIYCFITTMSVGQDFFFFFFFFENGQRS